MYDIFLRKKKKFQYSFFHNEHLPNRDKKKIKTTNDPTPNRYQWKYSGVCLSAQLSHLF